MVKLLNMVVMVLLALLDNVVMAINKHQLHIINTQLLVMDTLHQKHSTMDNNQIIVTPNHIKLVMLHKHKHNNKSQVDLLLTQLVLVSELVHHRSFKLVVLVWVWVCLVYPVSLMPPNRPSSITLGPGNPQ